MNPSIKEMVDVAVKQAAIAFATELANVKSMPDMPSFFYEAVERSFIKYAKPTLEAAFNRGKEAGYAEEGIKCHEHSEAAYKKGQADIIQKLKGEVEGMKQKDPYCSCDDEDCDANCAYSKNAALSQVIQLLDKQV